jgi:hypothetical protein
MKHEPTIQSIGPPPEKHAQRLAAEMTRWLIEKQHSVDVEWRRAIRTRDDGNPAAQRRMVEKLKRIGGENVFAAYLKPGKRRKYELTLHRWTGWGLEGSIFPGETIPERPWIGVFLTFVRATYAKVDVDEHAVAIISHHALARLAERCGARKPQDLIGHARKLSNAVMDALLAQTVDFDKPPPGGCWRIPYDGGIMVLGLTEEDSLPLVLTVLAPEGERDGLPT